MPPKSAPRRRVPSVMQHYSGNLPVWKEKWFRNIAVDQSQPMKGEMKSQAHSTVPEYQVPFGYPSPGEPGSLSPENRASFESVATIPDEGHSSGPDENTDDIVSPSNSDHASSDAQMRFLLGVPSVTASTHSCNSRKESPLRHTPSPGSVPLHSEGAISDDGSQYPYSYSDSTDITSNSSYNIYSPTPNPSFQHYEPQSHSDVASTIFCSSAYPSVVGEMQLVQPIFASSNIYTQGTSTYAPARSGHQYLPGAPVVSGYERTNQRAPPPRARTYPLYDVLRGRQHTTRTLPRSSGLNFRVSGSHYHPYQRYAQLPQDAEQGYSQRTLSNEERSPENFANSSPFQSSGNIIGEGSLLYQHPQQHPRFPNPQLHLGNFSDYAEISF